jgi:histidine triad (HIT) family protein
LVVPKGHYSGLGECPAEVLSEMVLKLGPIASAVVSAGGFDGYNVFCNVGRAAGQLVDHLHFHVVGRRGGDGVFSHWPAGRYEVGRMEAVAAKIRKNLSGC